MTAAGTSKGNYYRLHKNFVCIASKIAHSKVVCSMGRRGKKQSRPKTRKSGLKVWFITMLFGLLLCTGSGIVLNYSGLLQLKCVEQMVQQARKSVAYVQTQSKHLFTELEEKINVEFSRIYTYYDYICTLILSKNESYEGLGNLELGIPGEADCIVERPGYSLGYSEYHEQAAWVMYHLTAEEAETKVTKRNDNFREDPEIPTGSATLADYRHSGYDRGHLAPAADMTYSVQTMEDSFYMSNMSPQKPAFNRGIWKDLEAQVRQFAIAEQDVFIVTGPILPKTKTITIGADKVTVPTHFYKVIYDLTPPEKMIGFILPNEDSLQRLQKYAVTVDAVELATGLNFFSLVPQPKQEELESTLSLDDWQWLQ